MTGAVAFAALIAGADAQDPAHPGAAPTHITEVRDNEPVEFLDAIVVQSSAQMDGFTTYSLAVRPTRDADVSTIYSIFGDGSDQGGTSMTFPAAFQAGAPFGADVGGVDPLFVTYAPESACDSWLTVGITESNSDHALSSVGIDFTQWTDTQPLTVANGAVFWMEPTSAPLLERGANDAVMVAQLTLPASAMWRAVVNVQGKNKKGVAGGDWKHHGLVFDNNAFLGGAADGRWSAPAAATPTVH
jgi:hypothetical protein